jgi:hypothetical protein
MPPVLPKQELRQLAVFAEGKNGVDILTTQQNSGVGGAGPSGASAWNNVSIENGSLAQYPNPATNHGAQTSGTGWQVLSNGAPIARAGVITWVKPEGRGTVTEAMLCFLDAAGNVRITYTTAGAQTWKTNGEHEGWLYEF